MIERSAPGDILLQILEDRCKIVFALAGLTGISRRVAVDAPVDEIVAHRQHRDLPIGQRGRRRFIAAALSAGEIAAACVSVRKTARRKGRTAFPGGGQRASRASPEGGGSVPAGKKQTGENKQNA